MRHIQSFSFALEDVFSLYLNKFEAGFFVDIGCGHPFVGSNSRLLESTGWKGICIDIARHAAWDYHRSTRCRCVDATEADYASLFYQEMAPSIIDLLSIDVDDACYATLTRIPFDDFEFKIIMIEHDSYRTQHLRDPERAHLKGKGYDLLCSDVIHEPGKPFEDWWIKPEHFGTPLTDKIRSISELDIDIIRKFGYTNTITRLSGFNGSYPQVEIA